MFISTVYTSSSENDRKIKKIMNLSDLLGFPWQHEIYDRNFKQVFLTIMFCLYVLRKNSNMIQTFMFSKISEAKNGPYRP